MAAMESTMKSYPGLANVEVANRAEAARTIFYWETISAIVKSIWGGLVAAAASCLIACVGGTLFANQLTRAKFSFLRMLIPYTEVGFLLMIMTLAICMLDVFLWAGIAEVSSPPTIGPKLGIYTTVILVLIPGFRMWKWYWRWTTYLAAVCVLVGILSWL